MDPQSPADVEFAAQLRRTVDRVGGLGPVRLAAAFDPEATRADAVRALVQHLADAAADLAAEPRRTVPRLGDQAVADQLAVCGRDLLDAAAGCPLPERERVLSDSAVRLLHLRRRL